MIGEAIAEIIIQAVAYIVFQVPGAVIRWCIFRKKAFKQYLNDSDKNYYVVLLILCTIGLIYACNKLVN
jgi:hypothetical protein